MLGLARSAVPALLVGIVIGWMLKSRSVDE